jgi:hypothetical protein
MVYLPDKPEISTGKTPSLEVGTLTTGTGALVLELTLTLTLSGATMGAGTSGFIYWSRYPI